MKVVVWYAQTVDFQDAADVAVNRKLCIWVFTRIDYYAILYWKNKIW